MWKVSCSSYRIHEQDITTNNDMKNLSLVVAVVALVVGVLAWTGSVEAPSFGAFGDTNFTNVVTSGDITSGDDLTVTDAVSIGGSATVTGDLSVTGTVIGDMKVSSIAATNQYSTTTLTAANSGTTYFISASGTQITLPAVTTAGLNFRFVIGAAVDTANVVVASAEGDNIDGTLIVAGAVVDCRAEDFVNFIADGEQLGDYLTVYSNGTQWFIEDSGVLTAAKMTCTDPS